MRNLLIYIAATALIPLVAVGSTKPETEVPQVLAVDTAQAVSDSVASVVLDTVAPMVSDTVAPARSRIRREKVDLDAQVAFASTDSMLILRRDSAFMYGDGAVTYGDIKLNAAEIRMDLADNTVFAVGRPDSVGEMLGKPVFSDGGTDYEAATMRYNFATEKGYITDVVTEQGEGYLTGGVTKKNDDGTFFIKNGRYTTCDDHECPHFYFQLTKAKVKPGSNTVSGPAYMVLSGLPLPLAVPFGYFPFTDEYASGILVPSFGDDYERGFYLREGGYYFAINDYVDLALTGEIYTKGSWGLTAQSTYARRYKYNGSFSLSYLKSIYGEKDSPDYSKQTNFQVLWSHMQDSKANPNMSLSASVNFTTSGYTRNDLNSYYSNAFTENTKSSTVNMTYRFPQSKWSLSTTLNLSQRTQDSTLSVSFPNVTVTMSQTYPFKRKLARGDERWYEKIKMSYSGMLQNSLTAPQDEFFKKSLIKDWRNGMKHELPISATFNMFNYINITPQIRFTDRMYTTKVRRSWDAENSREVCDTTHSFYNVWDFSASVSLDTKIYGFFQPMGFLGKKIKMIRHVLTPTVSISAAPDFSSSFFGYYGNYLYTDNQGKQQSRQYSMFPNSLYGVPGVGKTGSISYGLSNNLEMKVKSDNDSIGERKISLIENLNITQSYNFAADSLNWSDINTSLLLRLTKGFNLSLSATWDVYTYQLSPSGTPVRVNVPRWKAGKGLARLRNTGTSFSYTFNNDTFRRKKENDTGNNAGESDGFDNVPESEFDRNRRRPPGERDDTQADGSQFDSDGYQKWEVPWSLSVNYSIGYAYGTFNKEKLEYDSRITQNLSFSGSIRPTKNWNFTLSASYDFDMHKIAYMNCSISRDLHCFSMRASFVPVGPYKNYMFNIAVKSAMLSDLKYDKRSSRSNGVDWY